MIDSYAGTLVERKFYPLDWYCAQDLLIEHFFHPSYIPWGAKRWSSRPATQAARVHDGVRRRLPSAGGKTYLICATLFTFPNPEPIDFFLKNTNIWYTQIGNMIIRIREVRKYQMMNKSNKIPFFYIPKSLNPYSIKKKRRKARPAPCPTYCNPC